MIVSCEWLMVPPLPSESAAPSASEGNASTGRPVGPGRAAPDAAAGSAGQRAIAEHGQCQAAQAQGDHARAVGVPEQPFSEDGGELALTFRRAQAAGAFPGQDGPEAGAAQ